jgi:hypothetical protein
VRDRTLRAQNAYAARLRDALDALSPLVDEGDAEALALARSIEAELAHIAYGTALVDT